MSASQPTITLLSVDVETDWAGSDLRGVREVLPRLVERLEHHGARATFFVVAELVDEVAGSLDPGGHHEVGSHGLDHRVLRGLPPDELDHQLRESRRRLSERGYDVLGFRAPFLRRPANFETALRRCGYRYDASLGSVWPSLAHRGALDLTTCADPERLSRVGTAALRGGLLPFNLTWLRLLHPLGRLLVSPKAQHFSCHLHEFLDGDGGLPGLPSALRRLHTKAAGATAWKIVEALLSDPARRFVAIRDVLTHDQSDGRSAAGHGERSGV